jgi:polyisoprenoid-binding protein YceI
VRGELTLKGVTGPIELTGTIVGPAVGLGGTERIGLELEGSFDRTDYGLSWNAELPGGGLVVGDVVRVGAHLELARS